jgi:hypothetical protein
MRDEQAKIGPQCHASLRPVSLLPCSVHIVNKNTGSYLLNLEKTEEPVIYHYEELTAYNKIEKRYEATESDLLLPFATALCDFRALGNSRGVWNQSNSLSMQNSSSTTLPICYSTRIHSSSSKCLTSTHRLCFIATRRTHSTRAISIEWLGAFSGQWALPVLTSVGPLWSYTDTNTTEGRRDHWVKASYLMCSMISCGITTKNMRALSLSN